MFKTKQIPHIYYSLASLDMFTTKQTPQFCYSLASIGMFEQEQTLEFCYRSRGSAVASDGHAFESFLGRDIFVSVLISVAMSTQFKVSTGNVLGSNGGLSYIHHSTHRRLFKLYKYWRSTTYRKHNTSMQRVLIVMLYKNIGLASYTENTTLQGKGL